MMNPTRIVGGVALAVGGGLLLGELIFGQAALTEITGAPWVALRFLCGTLAGSGLIAIGLSIRERKDLIRDA